MSLFSTVLFQQIFRKIIKQCNISTSKKFKLPPITKLTDETLKAWVSFENEGAGGKIESYYREDVQEILRKLIGENPIFIKGSYVPKSPVLPEYQLVRPDKLDKLNETINKILSRHLLTIPMYTARVNNMDIVLQKSPELANYDDSKYVFTDTSLSKTKRNRTIVVRHTDGSLRQAAWEVRDRIDVVYFGDDGKVYPFPKFITDLNVLKDALTLDNHLYILNSALCICEPDDKNYINVLKTVFDDVIDKRKFHLLEFSPFYGPLMFHSVMENKFKNVIAHYLELSRIYTDETQLDYPIFMKHLNLDNYMKLYILLKPQSKTAIASAQNSSDNLFEIFCQELEL